MGERHEADRKRWLAETIGHPEDDVRKAVEAGGGRFRVTHRDGAAYPVTRDYDLNRVSVRVVRGMVTEAHYG